MSRSERSTTNVEDTSKPGMSRRDLLANAAVEVIASTGLAGLTHRAVDRHAGVSEGSASYYFSKRADLIDVAAERVAAELAAVDDAQRVEFAELIAAGRRDEAMRRLAAGLVACADEHRVLFLARLELSLLSSRDADFESLCDQMASASRRPIEFFLTVLTEGGKDLPISITAGVLDGLALNHVTGEVPMPSVDEIVAIVTSLLGLSTDQPTAR